MTTTRIAGAIAALALTLSGGSIAAAHRAPPTRGETPRPTSAGKPLLGPNQVATADQVPWDKVGRGWYLTSINQGKQGDYGIDPDHQLLDLVDPLGGRYQMLKTGLGKQGRNFYQLVDWTADGQVALLFIGGGTAHARAVQVDLKYGTRHVTALPKTVAAIALGPTGSLFASEYGTARGEPVVRIDQDGSIHRIARHVSDLGLPSADGQQLVVAPQAARNGRLRLITSEGTVVRDLPVPGACTPVRWWAKGVVMASCFAHTTTRLYAVPIDGSAPTAISGDHGKKSRDLGDIDARRLGGVTYLEASGPCGYVFLARQHADGTATQVKVPRTPGNVYLLGTRGTRLVLEHEVSCDGDHSRSAITLFAPRTGVDTVIALLPKDEAYNGVLAFGERRTSPQ
jgi:hypothetical protein